MSEFRSKGARGRAWSHMEKELIRGFLRGIKLGWVSQKGCSKAIYSDLLESLPSNSPRTAPPSARYGIRVGTAHFVLWWALCFLVARNQPIPRLLVCRLPKNGSARSSFPNIGSCQNLFCAHLKHSVFAFAAPCSSPFPPFTGLAFNTETGRRVCQALKADTPPQGTPPC